MVLSKLTESTNQRQSTEQQCTGMGYSYELAQSRVKQWYRSLDTFAKELCFTNKGLDFIDICRLRPSFHCSNFPGTNQ